MCSSGISAILAGHLSKKSGWGFQHLVLRIILQVSECHPMERNLCPNAVQFLRDSCNFRDDDIATLLAANTNLTD